MKRLLRVGLTGGIATGKSTTLRRWQRAGAGAIDADDLAHRALEPGTPTWDKVVRRFGREILDKDNTVSRPRLGEIVFANEQKRQALNRIVHPAVRRMWAEELRNLERDADTDAVVVSVPLLYEVAAEAEFDCVVAVGCSEETELARLKQKGLTEASARARIRAQWPLQRKLDRADFVIWNDGSLRVHAEQADRIWATIKETYHAPSKNQPRKN
jgi:dephospho-CoA kinase